MGRLIDADKIHPDVRTKRGALAISQGQLAYAPTVEAIPKDRIEQMVAEIETELETLRAINTEQNKASDYYMNFEIANMSGMIGGYVKTLDVIHKYTKEPTKDPFTQAVSDSLVAFSKQIIENHEKEQNNGK